MTSKRNLKKRLEELEDDTPEEHIQCESLSPEEKRELDEMFSGGMNDEQREQFHQLHEQCHGVPLEEQPGTEIG